MVMNMIYLNSEFGILLQVSKGGDKAIASIWRRYVFDSLVSDRQDLCSCSYEIQYVLSDGGHALFIHVEHIKRISDMQQNTSTFVHTVFYCCFNVTMFFFIAYESMLRGERALESDLHDATTTKLYIQKHIKSLCSFRLRRIRINNWENNVPLRMQPGIANMLLQWSAGDGDTVT